MAMGIWLPGGGGGGASSDDCTLMRAAVPAGMKAVTADSDDEAMEGTLNPDTTLADSQALSGQTFLKWNPQTKLFEKRTGSMANRGAVSQSLAINGSYTIPAGYHNGSGKVSQKVTTKGAQTFTPGTTNQTIAANQFLTGVQTILGDPNLIGANIIQGKTIFGVPGSAVEYKSPSNLSEKPVLAWNKGGSIEISIDTEAGLGLKNKTGNYILVKLNAGNAVNLSGWKYLKASIRLSTYAGNGKCYLGVSTNPSLQAFSFNASWAMDWVVNSSNTYAPAIDISSLNGTYFI